MDVMMRESLVWLIWLLVTIVLWYFIAWYLPAFGKPESEVWAGRIVFLTVESFFMFVVWVVMSLVPRIWK